MTNKDFDENAEVPEQGSGAEAPGPEPDSAGAEGADTNADELTVEDILAAAPEEDTAEAAEPDHLSDLKRVQAEYANYRKRTEEQRGIDLARAKGEVAKGLLPVLDDLDRAGQHGDLEEGSAFAAIADKVRGVAEKLGVVSYGEAGEEFDPQQHEAIFQQPTPGATTTTILEVVEVGYRLGDIELRPAKVVVAVPAE